MSQQKELMTVAEMTAQLEAERRSGGRRKIYKAESDELRTQQISADLDRKIDGLAKRKPRVNLNDLEEVKRRTTEYLTSCRDAGVIPTVSSFAVMALNVTRRTLNDFIVKHPDSPSSYFLEQTKDLFSDVLETGALTHSLDNVMSIFILKNDHNRADRMQIEPVPPDPLGREIEQAALEAKLQDIVIDEN